MIKIHHLIIITIIIIISFIIHLDFSFKLPYMEIFYSNAFILIERV